MRSNCNPLSGSDFLVVCAEVLRVAGPDVHESDTTSGLTEVRVHRKMHCRSSRARPIRVLCSCAETCANNALKLIALWYPLVQKLGPLHYSGTLASDTTDCARASHGIVPDLQAQQTPASAIGFGIQNCFSLNCTYPFCYSGYIGLNGYQSRRMGIGYCLPKKCRYL